jgi:hypothetical protein
LPSLEAPHQGDVYANDIFEGSWRNTDCRLPQQRFRWQAPPSTTHARHTQRRSSNSATAMLTPHPLILQRNRRTCRTSPRAGYRPALLVADPHITEESPRNDEVLCWSAAWRHRGGRYQIEMCKVPTTRLAAKPNRNEQGSVVVRLRYAAIASAGCTGLEAARRPANRMAIIGTAVERKRRSGQSGTSTCCRAWRVNPKQSAFLIGGRPLATAQTNAHRHRIGVHNLIEDLQCQVAFTIGMVCLGDQAEARAPCRNWCGCATRAQRLGNRR